MKSTPARLGVIVLALAATYVFFYEYLPPFKRVHIFSDIEGYHYPLARYAFQALKEGRIPQWDASIYCGITFLGNIQAAILYPPGWLMYAASWHYRRLPFKVMEAFAIAHVCLAFLLCYGWFRSRKLQPMASALGAAVFACGGYMISQIVHLGVETGLAWMPLGLWGIDDAVARRDWRPLWKTALASAMCFLAGYPLSWVVFCGTNFVYALTSRLHWRAALGAAAAIAGSMLLAMCQLLPTLQARSFMVFDEKYGGGAHSWQALLPFFVPNWFDYNLHTPVQPPDDTLYGYLGLAAIFGILWMLSRGGLRACWQPIITGLFCLIMATNPAFLVYRVVSRFPVLERTMQSYNFYEGVAIMAALFTALSLHDFLERSPRRLPGWVVPGIVVAMAAWSIHQLALHRDGGTFASGFGSLRATAIAAALFAVALWTLRGETGARRFWLAAALLLFVGIDYKVYGTVRWFNTRDIDPDTIETHADIAGVNDVAYHAMIDNRQYRVASDLGGGPNATDYRKWGLAGAQGFDPFLPDQYHQTIERWVKFDTNRLFRVDFWNPEMMRSLGVRYVFTHEKAGQEPRFAASPDYRLVGPDDSFYRIYEYRLAKAPYGWDVPGEASPKGWLPEKREFTVHSAVGGRFFLVEQFFPGWQARVDGKPAVIERWNGAFQAIHVPAGEHTVTFEFHTRFLVPALFVSLAALCGLLMVARSDLRVLRGLQQSPNIAIAKGE